MIPNIFSPKQASYDYILHKWFEIGFGSRFYDKETFRMFIELTPFKKVELIQAAPSSSLYLCAMQKGSENQEKNVEFTMSKKSHSTKRC
jgi:hypothetical protein